VKTTLFYAHNACERGWYGENANDENNSLVEELFVGERVLK